MTGVERRGVVGSWGVAGLALIPCAVLLGGRWLLAIRGPAAARASAVSGTETALIIVPRPMMTEAQEELRATMRALAARGFGASPVVARMPEVETPQGSGTSPRVEAEESPSVVLKAVMRAGESPVAIIDGKVRRAGDEVAPRWVVGEIDVQACEVTLVGPEGRRHVLRLRSW
jgi:hypothetical protein